MRKSQIIKRQVNLKNEADFVVCPYRKDKIIKHQPAFGCHLNCDRYAGNKNGYILCGAKGTNKDILVDRSNPRLHQILVTYGDNLDYVVGAYGKPKV